jgi:hypothetical protein
MWIPLLPANTREYQQSILIGQQHAHRQVWGEAHSFSPLSSVVHFGTKRVAMKQGSTVTYLHGDHLGSTSVASNDGGALVSRQTYFPYGAPRDGTVPTDYTFTGQKFARLKQQLGEVSLTRTIEIGLHRINCRLPLTESRIQPRS